MDRGVNVNPRRFLGLDTRSLTVPSLCQLTQSFHSSSLCADTRLHGKLEGTLPASALAASLASDTREAPAGMSADGEGIRCGLMLFTCSCLPSVVQACCACSVPAVRGEGEGGGANEG